VEWLGNPAVLGIFVSPLIAWIVGSFAARREARHKLDTFFREWERSRRDVAATNAVTLIQELATGLAAAIHSMCWLTWRAAYDRDSIGEKQIGEYDYEMHGLLPKIEGAIAALYAISPASSERIEPIAAEVVRMDAEIGLCCVTFRGGDIGPLADAHPAAVALQERLMAGLRGASESLLEIRNPQR
jgi:hypothetical protein